MNEQAEESYSQAERIRWLRERGVKIDFPKEEQHEMAVECPLTAKEPERCRRITAVHIPADEQSLCTEVSLEIPREGPGDQLISVLKG